MYWLTNSTLTVVAELQRSFVRSIFVTLLPFFSVGGQVGINKAKFVAVEAQRSSGTTFVAPDSDALLCLLCSTAEKGL